MNWLTQFWPALEALIAWARTRGLARRLRTPADVVAWQRRRVERLQRRVLPRIQFYADAGGRTFEDLPIVDKQVVVSQFEAFNRPGITARDAWAAIAEGGRHDGYYVGASTGTSGNRGLYVISEAERWRWLGTVVAKTMPRLRRARIALILPLDTSLYAAARRSLLELRFFDLTAGLEVCSRDVAAFDPDTLIAPPKVLRWLGEHGGPLRRVRQVFSAAEVLDPQDRTVIADRFGVIVREIYMATEGLLGVACEHGMLHLCEDCMKFEFEEPVPGSGLVSPIITDFSRETQAMVRYRMNDLLRLAEEPCPCGSPLQGVAQVEGRVDDLLLLPKGARRIPITPDVLRNAIVRADRRIDDFRLVQMGSAELELALPAQLPQEAVEAARASLAGLLATMGVAARIEVQVKPVLEVTARKLRRIERRWQP